MHFFKVNIGFRRAFSRIVYIIINHTFIQKFTRYYKNTWDYILLLLFSLPVMSDYLWLHGLQHARPLCPSPSPEVCPSSCPLNQWCHPFISSSDAFFPFCPQSFPASGSFPMSQLFASDAQNTGVSASASVLPTGIQGWFPLRLTGLISLLSKGLSTLLQHYSLRH